jgi:predicted ATP-binding protein involved in virulence
MKLKKIIVRNLFGIFDHEIPLNLDNHITIIHGPNGFGKTILLTMLNALFTSDYQKLRSIPFTELSLHFTDKSELKLKKEKTGQQRIFEEEREAFFNAHELNFEFSQPDLTHPERYKVSPIGRDEIDFPLSIISGEIPELVRIGIERWLLPSGEEISLDDVLERFGNRLPISKPEGGEEPSWLKDIINSIDIHFIESQRLLSLPFPHRLREYERRHEIPSRRSEPAWIPTVTNYSEELAEMIQKKLAEYAALAQSLDRSFPTRLVRGNSSIKMKEDELRANLNELEKKRSRLMSAGFLRVEEEIDFKELLIDETNKNVLSIYIEDNRNKLRVFDELDNKINLLKDIINKKFLYKQMTTDDKSGFVFKAPDGETIPLTSLSSGEQHELVLHYDFLFHVKPDSLILIDEPELSLHVGWQHEFLKDLEEITQLTGFDVLIATHSPQIIHNRWDLTVELKGPKNEKFSHG